MIQSFKHKGLKSFFEFGKKKGIQSKHALRLRLILDILDTMSIISDIDLPNLNLHKLEPKFKNIWSVKVSGNWRITFKYNNNDVDIVDYLDYH